MMNRISMNHDLGHIWVSLCGGPFGFYVELL